ncbi:MAG: hypothetical protein F6K36_25760 [Symploca sp. SIO3C6]|nr:hypothetical protein [Symploca sp. SIO3C6]
MAKDNPKYRPGFEEEVKSVVVGEGNIIYNKFYIPREDLRGKPIKSEKTAASEKLPCPYRGLSHFDTKYAEFFFGREVFIEELFKATQVRNFIPVLGVSGSGKSSVVLAGLVPKLQQSGHWLFPRFRPGSNPFHALALALVPLYTPNLNATEQIAQARQLAGYFREGKVSLADVFAQIHQNHPTNRVLLIADQFEELYTLCADQKIRLSFLDTLLDSFQTSSSQSQFNHVLVATMRADFLGNALSYRPFADVLQNTDIKLGSMNHKELVDVIVNPTEKLNEKEKLKKDEKVTFQPGLVERILNDVENETGHLPLLEFALEKLWEKRKGKWLTHKAYEEIGGVKGALSKHASKKYNELTPTEQQQAKQIFIQLVQPGKGTKDTRRLATKAEFGDAKWSLVNKLADRDHRLVVTSRKAVSSQDTDDNQDHQQRTPRQNLPINNSDNAENDVVEVAHEALIQNWELLQEWIITSREFRIWQERLQATIDQWEETKKDPGSLLKGKSLTKAEKYLQEREYDFSEPQKKYVHESRKASRKDQMKTTAYVTGGLLTILTVSSVAWLGFNQESAKTAIRNLEVNGVAELQHLKAAQQILQDAERNSENKSITKALADYRQVILYTKLLKNRFKNQDNEAESIALSQKEIKRLEELLEEAERGLFELIKAERLPQLEAELKAPNGVGQRINTITRKRSERFSPGALRTTYKILHDDFGIGADLDKNGELNHTIETELIPCPILEEIEKLWRQKTSCGWYDRFNKNILVSRISILYDPNCRVLQDGGEGVTLTKHIFEGTVVPARERIIDCVIKSKLNHQ